MAFKTENMWRKGAALVLSAAMIASLSACALRPAPNGIGPSSSPADTSGIAAELVPFYTQEVNWESCGSDECATIVAPLDWENVDLGEIEIAMVRKASASGDPVASLLMNPGGPGASGISLVQDSGELVTSRKLRQSFDLIGFDPRGVGQSTAVSCFDAAEMDQYLFDIPASPRGSEQWEQELMQANQEFADACEANSDGILEFITTQNSARDMDLIRGVLGDEKMYYLGFSYGTTLGANYAELFPHRVGRMVLDGATDPTLPGSMVGATQAIGFESALRAYMEYCLSESDDCTFAGSGVSVDQGMLQLNAMLKEADRQPLESSDGRYLGGDSLLTAIVTALYSQESWPYLDMALNGVALGEPDIAFSLVDVYYEREFGDYASNQTEAFTAYNCMDYPLESEAAEAEAEALVKEKAPTIAEFWSGPSGCRVWPYPPSGNINKITAEGTDPILVVGTTNDPATPYAWSVALADHLSDAVLLTRVGEGHVAYRKGNSCIDTAIDDYLINGTLPADGTRCE